MWEVRTANIKWRKHFLKEPQERVREASVAEEAAIISKLSRGYDIAIRFAFLTGCRKKEILGLEWTDVSFTGRCFTVVGKGSRKRTIPMSKAIYALLWGEQGNHPKKVFTFVSSMTRRVRGMVYEKGNRYPLSNEGVASAMERAVADAGVTDFRLHDTRHTTATRIARKSNLKVAQKLLGHSDIRITLRYVHAMQDDVRDALEAISRTEDCTETEVKAVKD